MDKNEPSSLKENCTRGKWRSVKDSLILSSFREASSAWRPPRSDSDTWIDPTSFTPYARSIVAPNHCICGIIGSVMTDL